MLWIKCGDHGRFPHSDTTRLAALVMRHLLPRANARAIMGRAVKGFDVP
jgi:hypothetical protein